MSALGDFLVQRFATDELFRLLWGLLGDRFVVKLPNYQNVSRAGFATEAELRMRDGGAIDEKLFDRLLDERPRFQAEIAEIAREEGRAWPRGGVVAAAAPGATRPAPQASGAAAPAFAPVPVILDLILSLAEAVARVELKGGPVQDTVALSPASKTLTSRVSRLRKNPAQRALGESVGDALSELLLRDGVGRVYQQSLSAAANLERPLHVRLQLRGGWDVLPWELLRLPDEPRCFVAQQQQVWLTRELPPGSARPRPALPTRPRVLLAGANTSLARSISVEDELAALCGVWRAVGVEPVVLRDATWKRLRDMVGDQPWSLLHFAGHGAPGRLIMADGYQLQGREFADMVAGGLVGRVYLNACSAATPGKAAPRGRGFGWDSVATTMLGEGCTDAVAFGAPLDDEDGLRAAVPWHEAFASGQGPVQATARARFTLRTSEALGFGFLQHFTTSR